MFAPANGALSGFEGAQAQYELRPLPVDVVGLLGQSLVRTTQAHTGGAVMIAVSFVVALWSLAGAMQTVMWAMNRAVAKEAGPLD